MRPLTVIALIAAAVGVGTALPAPVPPAPVTAVDTTIDTIQGVGVPDPYRWLERGDDPKVQAWTDAENARTRAYLDGLSTHAPLSRELKRLYTPVSPHRYGPPLTGELKRLVRATSPYYYGLVPRGDRVFAVYRDPMQEQPIIVALNASADPRSRVTVLDPNTLDPNGLMSFDWFVPSPDGTRIAVSLSKNGSEDGTLHVYDVTTRREVETPIEHVQSATAGGSVAWLSDNKGFWYTRYPGDDSQEVDRRFNVQVYLHRAGRIAVQDPLALGAKDGLERISEVTLRNTDSRSEVLATVARGDGGQFAHYLLAAGKAPLLLSTYEDGVVAAALAPDGAIYGISRHGTLNGRVIKLVPPFNRGALGDAPTIVPECSIGILTGNFSGVAVSEPTVAGGRLYVRYINGGPVQVQMFDRTGKPLGLLPIPPVATNTEVLPLRSGAVLFDVESYTVPPYYERFEPTTNRASATDLKQTSPVSFDDAEVVREFAASKDGTKVPLNIIRRKGVQLDGSNPTLLRGYGSYGLPLAPHFLGPMWRLWLDAGGVYAEANIRGGSEYGERWHREGMLTSKQNTFDDFVAAARYLITSRYTRSDRLALLGTSAGGLAIGAIITQHPDLPRAVVADVGMYDMLRFELDPNGSFNVTEFGTVQNAAQFQALRAYSPYHNVRNNTAYPAVLMLTGATDPRVNPMQSRKFTAALQASSTNPLVLLRTNQTSGHGAGTALDERIAEHTDILAFLFEQLGMSWSPLR